MSNDTDDQLWLDALAGRGAADSPAGREAQALRQAIAQRTATEVLDDVSARDPEREALLLARAQREGLLPEPRPRRVWWAPNWGMGLVVATLAGVAIALGLYLQVAAPPPVVRSSPDGIVRLVANDPVQLKQQLLEDLRAAGVQATGYELLGRQGVDADLPQPLPDAVRAVLRKHRIGEPADGVLRIEISRPEPP